MNHIYKLETIYSIESHTMTVKNSIYELIENAANAFVHWILPQLRKRNCIHVLCGKGNNGADGLLVATKLANYGFSVVVLSVNEPSKSRSVNGHYLDLIKARKDLKFQSIISIRDLVIPHQNVLLIDGLLGIGANRVLKGLYVQIVSFCNKHYSQIYAIDCPSGLLPSRENTELAIEANQTFTFQFPKLSFFAAENEKFIGDWSYGQVGLLESDSVKETASYSLIEQKDINEIWVARPEFSHKGLMGKALFILNNADMLGASLLAAKACFTLGTGIVYGFCQSDVVSLLAINEPEIIFKHNDMKALLNISKAVCVGPGMGQGSHSIQLVDRLLSETKHTLVLDADALNIIAKNEWIDRVPPNSILTPHLKEFERLFGSFNNHQERIDGQRKYAQQHKVYIILKGRYTSTADPTGHIYYNQTGNAALAKGGSGDILAGMITSLVCQNYPMLQACIASVWIHGLAADLYVKDYDEKTLTPSKLIDYLSIAVRNRQL